MPKVKISEFSSTPASNTDIDGINIAEGCAPSGINDAIRELMAQLKDFQTGAVGDSFNGPVGTSTAAAGAFTTLSATGVTTVQAGSAGAPAITTSGDTNTGIFFPAADTIAFSEGGVETARFDSAGNLGLGVTPSAWGTDYKALQIAGYAAFAQRPAGSGDLILSWNAFNTSGNTSGSGYVYKNTGDVASSYEQNGAHRWYVAPSGTAGNAISFTQAMTLDASGNLGIGATSLSCALEVARGSGAAAELVLRGNGAAYGAGFSINCGSTNDAVLFNRANTAMIFGTNSLERARIDSSGNFDLTGGGTFSSIGVYNNTTASSANVHVSSAGGLFFRSTSALKYKQDIRDVEDFDISGLRPVRYKSKCESDDQTKDHLGLIADEAAEAGFEELVTRGANGEVESFQYERLTVVLLKKLQTLTARVQALESN